MLNYAKIINNLYKSIIDTKIINDYLHIIMDGYSDELYYQVFNLNTYNIYKSIYFKNIKCANFVDNNIYLFDLNNVYIYDITSECDDNYENIDDLSKLEKIIFSQINIENSNYSYAFKHNNDLYFVFNTDNIILINYTKNIKNTILFNINTNIIIYNDCKLYIFKTNRYNDEYSCIISFDIETYNTYIINHKAFKYNKIGNYKVSLINEEFDEVFDIFNINTLLIDNKQICKDFMINELIYFINENMFIFHDDIYIHVKNTIENIDENINEKDLIILNGHKIQKNILISRCDFFKDINNLYGMNEEYNNINFENIEIYINYIKYRTINIDEISKLINICIYLSDVDSEYIAYYLVSYMNNIYKNYKISKDKEYKELNLNKYLNILYDTSHISQFYMFLNNHLNKININDYYELIKNSDNTIRSKILKYFSRYFIF